MGLMEKITKGARPRPPRILVYGPAGVGKSSWAAQAPSPIFIPTEDGLDQIECDRFDHVTDYAKFVECLKAVRDEPHGYKTLVIDSLTALQNLVTDGVCKAAGVKFLETAYGGYNRGQSAALTQLRKDVYGLFDEIRSKRSMAIVQIAHDHVENIKRADGTSDRRLAPRLIAGICDWVAEWNDIVISADFRTIEDANGNRMIVGKNGGEREMYAVGTIHRLAKNRYGIAPGPHPFTWDVIWEAITKMNGNAGEVHPSSATSEPPANGQAAPNEAENA